MNRKVAELRRKFAGAPVTATEPVFGYMADALRLEMRNRPFQTAVIPVVEEKILHTPRIYTVSYRCSARESGCVTRFVMIDRTLM